jgi:hypothetical protein
MPSLRSALADPLRRRYLAPRHNIETVFVVGIGLALTEV